MLSRVVLVLAVCVLPGAAVMRAANDDQVFVFGGQEPSGSYLGVSLRDIDDERAKALSLKDERGAEVRSVEEESPAAKAGLKEGDVIVGYNDERVQSVAQFQRLVRETPPGRSVKLTVSRGGATQTLALKTASRPQPQWFRGSRNPDVLRHIMPEIRIPEDWQDSFMDEHLGPRLGIQGEAVDGQLASYFGVKNGVLVRSVAAGTPAQKAGIRAGDVITTINGKAIDSIGDISRALRSGASQSSVSVVLMRDKREMTVSVTFDEPAGKGAQV